MDHFREESVSKRQAGLNSILYVVCWIFMIITGLMAAIGLSSVMSGFSIPAIIYFLVTAGACAGLYFLKNNLKIEYDYTFTNGILDIAKVINNSKRKKLLSLDVRTIEKIAPTDDGEFERVLKNNYVKKYNYFLNPGRLYYVIYSDQDGRKFLVFEPSEALIKMAKVYNPGSITV